ncbi:MAG: acyltransferase family protein, partial [Prevotellaceae bacterium]|nr:acyltransferase family protein [Prevotellaceae bacterium]
MSFVDIQQKSEEKRIVEIDYLKSVFILLMIAFHLAYFADNYPYLKQFVYTFHMSGFLIISGYLMKAGKTVRQYGRTILWLAVPYVIMETGYVGMASVLPIKDHVENLTLQVFLNKLLVNPLGPYWYLHTLILCGVLYFVTFRWIKTTNFSRLIVLGLLYYA